MKHDPDCVEREESQELTVVARPSLHMQQKDDFTTIKQTIADNVGAEVYLNSAGAHQVQRISPTHLMGSCILLLIQSFPEV